MAVDITPGRWLMLVYRVVCQTLPLHTGWDAFGYANSEHLSLSLIASESTQTHTKSYRSLLIRNVNTFTMKIKLKTCRTDMTIHQTSTHFLSSSFSIGRGNPLIAKSSRQHTEPFVELKTLWYEGTRNGHAPLVC
jgi:hypothetical protein